MGWAPVGNPKPRNLRVANIAISTHAPLPSTQPSIPGIKITKEVSLGWLGVPGHQEGRVYALFAPLFTPRLFTVLKIYQNKCVSSRLKVTSWPSKNWILCGRPEKCKQNQNQNHAHGVRDECSSNQVCPSLFALWCLYASEYPDWLWHLLDKKAPLSELQRKKFEDMDMGEVRVGGETHSPVFFPLARMRDRIDTWNHIIDSNRHASHNTLQLLYTF